MSDVKHVALDWREVNDLSLDLIHLLERNEISPTLACAALSLTLARFSTPEKLTVDVEKVAVPNLIEYALMLVGQYKGQVH